MALPMGLMSGTAAGRASTQLESSEVLPSALVAVAVTKLPYSAVTPRCSEKPMWPVPSVAITASPTKSAASP